MKLTDYIEAHHNGNISAFARSVGVQQSQAARWLKRNCVVIDGAVYCEVSKQCTTATNMVSINDISQASLKAVSAAKGE